MDMSVRTDLNLSKELLLGVETLGFKAPSKIQAAALPLVLNHQENLIAQVAFLSLLLNFHVSSHLCLSVSFRFHRVSLLRQLSHPSVSGVSHA